MAAMYILKDEFIPENQLKEAQASHAIETYKAQHSLGRFRYFTEAQYASQASHLADCLRVVHGDDIDSVIASLRETADEIADMGRGGLFSDGHHGRAAREIRKVADRFDFDGCPWRDLAHLLGKKPLRYHLAKCLWRENRARTDDWTVPLDVIGRDVWGDPTVARGTISTNLHRLKIWLAKHGIKVDFKFGHGEHGPHVRCKILDIDEDKIADILSADRDECYRDCTVFDTDADRKSE